MGAVIILAAVAAAGETPEEEFGLARSAFDDGLYTFALKRFERLKMLPRFARADDSALYSAKCQFMLGRFHKVTELLTAFPEQYRGSPLQPRARLWLGRGYLEKAALQTDKRKRTENLSRAAALFLELASAKMADRLVRADAEYFAARAYFDMGRLDEASLRLKRFLEVHSKSPYAPKARLLQGEVFFRLYRFEDAVRTLTRLLDSGGAKANDLDAYQIRAECYYCLKDWDKALADHREAAKLAAKVPERLYQARYGAGWTLFHRAAEQTTEKERRKDLEDAREEFLVVSRLPATERIARAATFKVGQILIALGRNAEAIPVLEQCTPAKTFPELYLQARYLLVKANREAEHYGKALAWIQEIEQYEAEGAVSVELSLAAGQEKAETLTGSGKAVEAAKVYLELRDRASKTAVKAEMFFMAAMSYLKAEELGKERYSQAMQILQEIASRRDLAAELSYSRLHYFLGRSAHRLATAESDGGDAGKARKLFDLAVKEYGDIRHKGEASEYAYLASIAEAEIHKLRGQPKRARDIFDALLKSKIGDDAERARLHLECARASRDAGDPTAALAHIETGFRIKGMREGHRAEALFLKGACLAEVGKKRPAADAYGKFLAEFPEWPGRAAQAAFERGLLLEGLGSRAEAMKSFDLSARLASSVPAGVLTEEEMAELASRAKVRAAAAALEEGSAREAARRYREVAAAKGEQAWEAELALAGIDLAAGRSKGALARLGRVLKEAGRESEKARRAAELAGRIHLAARKSEEAEAMFRLAMKSVDKALSVQAMAGLASSLYEQNRFDDAAEVYTQLYLATKGLREGKQALREKAIRGVYRSFRRSMEGATQERKLALLDNAMKLVSLSEDRKWRETKMAELRELRHTEKEQ